MSTTLQQRLRWKPVKRATFRHKNQFLAFFNTYCFATGKRYKRAPVRNYRKETKFICEICEQGYCYIRIHRKSLNRSWWIVKKVKTCDCGTPPVLLEDFQTSGPIIMVGQYIPQLSDWTLVAHACFPRGYSCDKSESSRRWRISCKGINCNGKIKIETTYLGEGRKYDTFYIHSATNCSLVCSRISSQNTVVPLVRY